METFLLKLEERFDEIHDFIGIIEIQKKLISEHNLLDKHEKGGNLDLYTNKLHKLQNSTVQYNAVIISIYGCYENFIDSIVSNYLIAVFDISENYNSLHKNIKTKHLHKSAEFILNPQRYKSYGIAEGEVINNLYKCFNNDDEAKLTIKLLIQHSGNLGVQQILELLKEIGVEGALNKIKSNEIFIKSVMDSKDIPSEELAKNIISKDKDYKIFEELNKLIEQRNDVAHSWVEDNRISYELIKSNMIPFIKVFCKVIYETLLCSYYSVLHDNDKIRKFDKAIKVINKNILCINSKNSRLKIGEYIFYKDKSGMSHISKIVNLEFENNSINNIEKDNLDVGIELSNKIKESYQYYYL